MILTLAPFWIVRLVNVCVLMNCWCVAHNHVKCLVVRLEYPVAFKSRIVIFTENRFVVKILFQTLRYLSLRARYIYIYIYISISRYTNRQVPSIRRSSDKTRTRPRFPFTGGFIQSPHTFIRPSILWRVISFCKIHLYARHHLFLSFRVFVSFLRFRSMLRKIRNSINHTTTNLIVVFFSIKFEGGKEIHLVFPPLTRIVQRRFIYEISGLLFVIIIFPLRICFTSSRLRYNFWGEKCDRTSTGSCILTRSPFFNVIARD